MIINGLTEIIAHIGYPTYSFKAPMIYNPYFNAHGINAVVTPFACEANDFEAFFKSLWTIKNVRGMLITMPHKVSVVGLLDQVSRRVQVAGACNAVKKNTSGQIIGDMFDGEGFVLGVKNKGLSLKGLRVLMIGAGGVGSAIAASLAEEDIAHISITDPRHEPRNALIQRLRKYYPHIQSNVGGSDPSSYDLVINASPLGMHPNDPLPLDIDQLKPSMFVGEVVMSVRMTPLLMRAHEQGCAYQCGEDMLFEQIPAYLEFFGFPTVGVDKLKQLATLDYVAPTSP